MLYEYSILTLENTFSTAMIFIIAALGMSALGRYALNIVLTLICFPIMVYYYLKNPSGFHSNFGIDPEIVKNLPTIIAEDIHASTCVICTDEIVQDQEILVLRCSGRHYFHAQCIKGWLLQKVNCPICRSDNVLWLK